MIVQRNEREWQWNHTKREFSEVIGEPWWERNLMWLCISEQTKPLIGCLWEEVNCSGSWESQPMSAALPPACCEALNTWLTSLLRNPGAKPVLLSCKGQTLPPWHSWSLGLTQWKKADVMERGDQGRKPCPALFCAFRGPRMKTCWEHDWRLSSTLPGLSARGSMHC